MSRHGDTTLLNETVSWTHGRDVSSLRRLVAPSSFVSGSRRDGVTGGRGVGCGSGVCALDEATPEPEPSTIFLIRSPQQTKNRSIIA